MDDIAERIKKLEECGKVSLDDLRDDEGFTSTFAQATQAALRTHDEEKLAAFRNAVLNSALPQRPDELRREMFVRLIDSLTVIHFRLLSLMTEPRKWFSDQGRPAPEGQSNGEIIHMVFGAFPDLESERIFVEIALDDLQRTGLWKNFNAGPVRLGTNLEPRGSEYGKEFLKFISAPPEA
jgi:hypothetical protein